MDRGGITILRVTSPQIDSIACTLDSRSYAYLMEDGFMVKGVGKVAKTSVIAPDYWYRGPVSGLLRIAGIFKPILSNPEVNLSITGKMGGLHFSKSVPGTLAAFNLTNENVQGAFRESEQLATDNWTENVPAIKKLGIDYHIVTRQTSLLALEKGIALWKDTIVPQQGGAENTSSSMVADARMSDGTTFQQANSVNIDNVTLEEMANGVFAGIDPRLIRANELAFGYSLKKTRLTITVPEVCTGRPLTAQIFDLKGRLVMSRITAAAGNRIDWDINDGKLDLSGMVYILKLKADKAEKIFTLQILR
jgi:hypothetical protein